MISMVVISLIASGQDDAAHAAQRRRDDPAAGEHAGAHRRGHPVINYHPAPGSWIVFSTYNYI